MDDLMQQGRSAFRCGQWQKARDCFDQLLLSGNTAPEVYEELAKACWWLNDVPAVFEYRSKAYDGFLAANDIYGAARNAGWMGNDYVDLKGEFAIANGWFQRAFHLMDQAAESWELAFVTLLRGRVAFITEKDNRNAYRWLDESLAISNNIGSTEGQMMAKALKGFVLITEGKINEGMALLDEATLLATSEQVEDVNLSTITCCFLIDACERTRDFERAGQWCEKVQEVCRKWNFDAMFASCKTQYASVLMWKGEWQKAEKELLSSIELLEVLRPTYISQALVRLADLRRRQGRYAEAAELLDKIPSPSVKLLQQAAYAFDNADVDAAVDLAERYLRQLPEKEKSKTIPALELLVKAYIAQGRLKEAEASLSHLGQLAETINTAPLQAMVHTATGIIREATGDLLQAKQHLQDAVDIYDHLGAPYESAQARLLLADVLSQLNEKALERKELTRALEDLQKTGAERDAENVQKRLNKPQRAASRHHAITPEFTGRELEILRLIAAGKNNEEIAAQLYLSVRTVEKHLTNLYLKLDVSGKSARAFAASYAIRHKLILT